MAYSSNNLPNSLVGGDPIGKGYIDPGSFGKLAGRAVEREIHKEKAGGSPLKFSKEVRGALVASPLIISRLLNNVITYKDCGFTYNPGNKLSESPYTANKPTKHCPNSNKTPQIVSQFTPIKVVTFRPKRTSTSLFAYLYWKIKGIWLWGKGHSFGKRNRTIWG